ncbi:hypothetical protein PHISCL_01645 [Aspergillus sclerotialis]|uniref:Guanine nucleotide-exchange factor SEC12 n=1 Tax=Aspergillus sclerotialis TaxID=2070753 RepID=A0A3A2ZUN1_9EURO|nr:hypothetical protein PHISCL_01645 [Aspergillus sclerotialis]
MAPTIPSSKLTLSCPLFAADFDPRNDDYLLVGGGGGEGRSGELLDTSKRNEISTIVDLELSRDEDSVTSLAAAHSQDDSIIALAGINSSMAEQKRNNNQHLRSFKIDYPPRKTADAEPRRLTVSDPEKKASKEKDKSKPEKTAPLSQASLFRTKGAESGDTYQRVLRLSPWNDESSTRVAAITTGLAPSGEVVFFNATSAPTGSDVIGRIRLDSGEEAEDVDITDLDKGKFKVAYTNGVDVFTCQVASKTKSNASPDVSRVYSTPLPAKGKGKPKFRALRFLSPTSLLLLQNSPDRSGCELVLLHLPTSSDKKQASIIHRRKLHRTMKIGLGMDICNLGTNPENQEQSIIAVSGSNLSIEILTIEHDPSQGYSKPKPYTILSEVHPFSMTKIAFSNFIPPPHPVTPEVGPQSVKLASVSMGNTVVIHTLDLSPFPPPSTHPRYVLSKPGLSDNWQTFYSGSFAILILAFVCFLLQAFAEIRGASEPYLGAVNWLPGTIREAVARPYMFEPPKKAYYVDDYPSSSIAAPTHTYPQTNTNTNTPSYLPTEDPIHPHKPSSLRDILRSRRDAGAIDLASDSAPQPPSLIVRSEGSEILIETEDTASPDIRESTVAWEKLGAEERTAWLERLVESGHWAVEESESILTGVLFGTYSGLVGDWVRSGLP